MNKILTNHATFLHLYIYVISAQRSAFVLSITKSSKGTMQKDNSECCIPSL